ncbi:MAG TPA: hypothetical protein EYP22_07605, partial [Methanosarcinales archaeon]|nr:hypothetical protein [Methanosarcinales archaeon]
MMEDSEIEQRLNELTLRLNALESRIDRASPDVMLKEMLDIKEKLGALKQLTEYSDEKIDALSKKVYSLENKINELEKKLSTVENNLRIEINTVKSELNDRINTVEKNLIAKINTTENNLRKEIFEIGKSVSITPDGEYIVAGSLDDNIYLFNKEGELLWNYET